MVAFQKPHNEEGGTGRINFLFLSCLGVPRGSTSSGGRGVSEGRSPGTQLQGLLAWPHIGLSPNAIQILVKNKALLPLPLAETLCKGRFPSPTLLWQSCFPDWYQTGDWNTEPMWPSYWINTGEPWKMQGLRAVTPVLLKNLHITFDSPKGLLIAFCWPEP